VPLGFRLFPLETLFAGGAVLGGGLPEEYCLPLEPDTAGGGGVGFGVEGAGEPEE
jgi:hypothetical protein